MIIITNPPITLKIMRESWCSPLPRTAEDKFHARLTAANCVPLSIKLIPPITKAHNRDILTDFLKLTMQSLSYLDPNWAVTAEVSPALDAKIKLPICLHAQIACLASNQHFVLWRSYSKMQLAWWRAGVCRVFQRDSGCPVQLSDEGREANGVPVWPRLTHIVPL